MNTKNITLTITPSMITLCRERLLKSKDSIFEKEEKLKQTLQSNATA